jgi:hypothetical protein
MHQSFTNTTQSYTIVDERPATTPYITREISQNTESIDGTHGNVDSDNRHNLKVTPKMQKRLLTKTSNTSTPGLDGIGWQEVKI